MNVTDYETMIVHDKMSDKIIKLKFANTVWISSTDVTLISSTRLIKKDYDRDPHTNTLMYMKTGQKVCEISMHFNVLLLKFNSIDQMLNKQANFVHSSKVIMTKATSWFWHLRLEHCKLEVIDQLKKIDDIEMISDDKKASKTINCETCAVSKMHRIMTKDSADRTIKSY